MAWSWVPARARLCGRSRLFVQRRTFDMHRCGATSVSLPRSPLTQETDASNDVTGSFALAENDETNRAVAMQHQR